MKPSSMLRFTFMASLLSALALLASPARSDEKSVATYKQKCAACHGADGKAETPAGKAMKIRSFADPETAKMSEAALADVIEKGKGKMPKYGASMKPDEIKAMVAYIRTLGK